MAKQRSEAARCATAIRKHLKEKGIKPISVRSERYAGGSSVTAVIPSMNPEKVRELRAELDKIFQYGHFDSMTDYYDIDNRRNDVPQVQYVLLEVKFSEEDYQAAYDFIDRTGAYDFSNYGHDAETGLTRRDVAWQILTGNNFLSKQFWNEYKGEKSATD